MKSTKIKTLNKEGINNNYIKEKLFFIITNNNLSKGELKLYIIILSFINQIGITKISLNKLQEYLNTEKQIIINSISALTKKKLIIKKTKKGKNFYNDCTYEFFLPKEAQIKKIISKENSKKNESKIPIQEELF